MKKTVLSLFILGSFGIYVLWQGQGNPSASFATAQPTVVSKKSKSVAVLNSSTTTPKVAYSAPKPAPKNTVPVQSIPTPAPPPAPKKNGLYTDGTYTGSGADAYYGTVQVQAVIVNGKIADVRFLNYPQDRSTSRRINSVAMPYLTQEAISAQSANVNGVSGASDTSMAFRESLSSALSQARA